MKHDRSFLKLSARQTPGESLMNVCRAALNAERARALMIQLEASFTISRAEFWKNYGSENWSESLSSADANDDLCLCRTGADTYAALGAWRS
jgi:hypothetical protein